MTSEPLKNPLPPSPLTFTTSGDFCAGLRRLVALPGDTDDPVEFWRDLMVSVEYHCLSTMHWKNFFLEGSADEPMGTSPRAAVLTILENLSRQHLLDPAVLPTLAEAYLKLGQLPAAEYCASVAFALGQRAPAVLGLLVGKSLRENALPEARELVALAGALHPGGPETLYGEARLALAQGHVDEAVEQLEGLVALFAGYRPAWDLLLDTLSLKEEWDRAARIGDRAPTPFRTRPDFLKKRAAIEMRRQNPSRAKELLQEAFSALKLQGGTSARDMALLQLDLADLELHHGDAAKALELARNALPALGDDPDLLCRAAELMNASGRGAPQVEHFVSQALVRHPAHEGLLLLAGKMDFEAGRDQAAFDRLQAVAEKNPSRTEAIFLMSLVCLRNRQFAAAGELAAAVAQSDPSRAVEAWLVVADALRLLGRGDEAMQALETAAEISPEGHPAAEEIRQRIDSLKKNLKKS